MPELLGFQERDFNNDQEPQEFDPNYGFVPEDLKVLHRALYENDSRAKELLMRFDPSKGLSLAEHMRTLSEPDGEEKIILTYLAKGETSPEIAKRVNRSVRAYSYMKAELIEKMGVNAANRPTAEAV